MGRSDRRLAVVSDAVYPWNTGGKELRYDNLLRRLSRHGIAVDVYTMNWWGHPGPVTRNGITYHAICPLIPLYAGSRRSILQALMFSLASLRLLTKQFDVLEADVIPFLQVFPLKLVALARRKPFVVTWHELWGRAYWVEYLGPRGHLAAALETFAIRLPDRIIAASAGTATRIVEAGGSSIDVRVVPNGIDATELAAAADRSPGSVSDLLVVGRLLKHKNVDVALDALALLHRQGRPLTLRVVGEGPEAQPLREQAATLGLSHAVTFCAFLPDRADLLAAVATTKVLVFPSVREGFGMVALEALAAGTPVVTTDHRDNFARELVEPGVTGELCTPDARSLAEAVTRAMDRHELLADAARASAQAYDWDVLAERAAAVYQP